MNRLRLYLLALTALIVCSARADEGMWLLQLMQQQHSIDMMKKQGLKLEAQDLYNPNGVSLKDAVGIFGGGCTGEIISPEGLILTNHHCGYASIQQHSSVEHDYLTDGFWATSRDKELPTPGLKFTFIERIEDITDIVSPAGAARCRHSAPARATAGSNRRAAASTACYRVSAARRADSTAGSNRPPPPRPAAPPASATARPPSRAL